MLSPRIPRAPCLPVQEHICKLIWVKNTKMEEDDENGKLPHAVKLRDDIFCIYRGSNLNESLSTLVQIASVP